MARKRQVTRTIVKSTTYEIFKETGSFPNVKYASLGTDTFPSCEITKEQRKEVFERLKIEKGTKIIFKIKSQDTELRGMDEEDFIKLSTILTGKEAEEAAETTDKEQ